MPYSLGTLFPIDAFFSISTFPTMATIRSQMREFLVSELCEECTDPVKSSDVRQWTTSTLRHHSGVLD